ncbi:hypothetical protein LIP56_14210, partial [Anaerostipes hadrus]|uniref:hypothetical protein n=1 Tax=Anaerostipes hadrus TaxID=649756 RepID=UPI001D0134FC
LINLISVFCVYTKLETVSIPLTDFLQNADPPTLLHNSLRSNSARVGCDFAKNPMEFYHFVPLSFFMFL